MDDEAVTTDSRFAELTDPTIVRDRAQRVAERGWNETQFLYTPEWREAKRRIRSGDVAAIEAAVVFLEVDPWCVDSGYQKVDLYRLLASAPLAHGHKDRLRAIVLKRLTDERGRSNHTLRGLAHLANAVWTPDLGQQMADIPRASSPEHADREIRFLTFARHGHQASVRWGIDHDPDHALELPIHRPPPRSGRSAEAPVAYRSANQHEGLFFEL